MGVPGVLDPRPGFATATCASSRPTHYITPQNPDDSGSVSYNKPTPVLGVVWHATNDVNVYANAGVGFETPTFVGARVQAAWVPDSTSRYSPRSASPSRSESRR